MPDGVGALFRRTLRRGVLVADEQGLTRALADRLAEAKAARPGVSLDRETFVARLAGSIEAGEEAEEALRRLHVSDMYLACACEAGDPGAVAAFEAEFRGPLRAALRRVHRSPEELEDAEQRMRERLLVRGSTTPPRIAQYAGRGPLQAWVVVAALRSARSAARKKTHETPASDEAVFERASAQDDPGLALVKRRYRAEFKAAFEEAFGRLSTRDRNLLRLHHMDGSTSDEIGAVYGVHRATAARWVGAAREALVTETRAALERTLHVGRREFTSIVRLVQSQLDVSLQGLFRSRKE